ncbi:MAG: GAF domain-containing protein [Ardenticatenaceae bacterium]|nr:GAF domain-containing protein [Ardenticatenaceae bacterium]
MMPDSTRQTARTRLDVTLQQVARDVVTALGYLGAMVATVEKDGSLPVRAVFFDPQLAPLEKVEPWEKRISRLMGRDLSITNPDPTIARVYLNEDRYKSNLSVQAVKAREPVVSDDFFSLFTPILPGVVRPIFKTIQLGFGIKQVVAVPFFLEGSGDSEPEIVGNLFAIKQGVIREQDKIILTAFGRQAAAAIELERQRTQVLEVAKELTTELQASLHQDEQAIVQQIVEGVVSVLGYVAALVSTYERDDSLSLRVSHFNGKYVDVGQVEQWETAVSQLMGRRVSIMNPDPKLDRVYVHQAGFRDNLSVRAFHERKPVVSDEIYSLFTPVVPEATRPVFAEMIQPALGVKQVIAVPFFLETASSGNEMQFVGNLFAATADPEGFKREEIDLLQGFGQQAAVGIRNARLYREVEELYSKAEQQRHEIEKLYQTAEEQRQVAEVFGKMAFSAAANVHALRNHVGAFRAFMQILAMVKDDPIQLREMLQSTSRYIKRLEDATAILDGLHEPWHEVTDEYVDVNRALEIAISKANDTLNLDGHIEVQTDFARDLPKIRTSFDMLAEAFRILMKNGMEAILEKESAEDGTQVSPYTGHIQVRSCCHEDDTIEVVIGDDGVGISEEHMAAMFQMRWSTKETGMGFGLFWLKDYVLGLNGRVEVSSTLGEGTTFRIVLPGCKNGD